MELELKPACSAVFRSAKFRVIILAMKSFYSFLIALLASETCVGVRKIRTMGEKRLATSPVWYNKRKRGRQDVGRTNSTRCVLFKARNGSERKEKEKKYRKRKKAT